MNKIRVIRAIRGLINTKLSYCFWENIKILCLFATLFWK